MKLASVMPLLKKKDLDAEILSYYRAISNLSFFSKLLERQVATQLVRHIESRSLFVKTQSAYSGQSTETALLCVLNDLIIALDNRDASIQSFTKPEFYL